jgi:hypothetical protein
MLKLHLDCDCIKVLSRNTLQREVSTEPPCHMELVETSHWRVVPELSTLPVNKLNELLTLK